MHEIEEGTSENTKRKEQILFVSFRRGAVACLRDKSPGSRTAQLRCEEKETRGRGVRLRAPRVALHRRHSSNGTPGCIKFINEPLTGFVNEPTPMSCPERCRWIVSNRSSTD
ncbi:unnamed protein product [Heterotrigona itama]|uniref:Uncharacterized protein n=1 Tax=Heterotrigona itama TaxID=395501 RepID=A0A6V7H0C9_9HYME|nr:unnamed protein product [Heterotrigona itama]